MHCKCFLHEDEALRFSVLFAVGSCWAKSCKRQILPASVSPTHSHTQKGERLGTLGKSWKVLVQLNLIYILFCGCLPVCARSFLNISGVLLHVKSAMVSSPLHGASAFHDVFVIYLFLMRIKTDAREKKTLLFSIYGFAAPVTEEILHGCIRCDMDLAHSKWIHLRS